MRDRLAEVEFEQRGPVVIARLEGEVDGSNAEELRRALATGLPTASNGLVLDLSAVGYLDSAGIELLFKLARSLRERRQALHLVVPDDSPLRRVLQICDVGSVAPIDVDLEAAATAVRQSTG